MAGFKGVEKVGGSYSFVISVQGGELKSASLGISVNPGAADLALEVRGKMASFAAKLNASGVKVGAKEAARWASSAARQIAAKEGKALEPAPKVPRAGQPPPMPKSSLEAAQKKLQALAEKRYGKRGAALARKLAEAAAGIKLPEAPASEPAGKLAVKPAKEPPVDFKWVRAQMAACLVADKDDAAARAALSSLNRRSAQINAWLARDGKKTSMLVFDMLYRLSAAEPYAKTGGEAKLAGHIAFLASGGGLSDAKEAAKLIERFDAFQSYVERIYETKRMRTEQVVSMAHRPEMAAAAREALRTFFRKRGAANPQYAKELKEAGFSGAGASQLEARDILAAGMMVRRMVQGMRGKGQAEIAVWSVSGAAKEAAAAQPPRQLSPTELYLKDCSSKLLGYVRSGTPAEIFKFEKGIPGAEKSLERTLIVLGGNYPLEMQKALAGAFRGLAGSDNDFKAFLASRGHSRLEKMKEAELLLRPNLKAGMQMLQHFLNYQSQITRGEDARKLYEDLRVLNKHYLNVAQGIKADGSPSLQTLAALAVYQWRKANDKAAAGAWAAELKKAPEQKKIMDVLDSLK